MEGVASEAASLAGHLGLDNLCWVYDNNHITIEGNTRLAFTEDVATRFLAYGWNVLRVGDANDIDRIEQALNIFRKTKGRPTFIIWTAISVMVHRTSKTLQQLTASRSATKRSGSRNAATTGPRMKSFSFRMECTNISQRAWARAARVYGANGRSCWKPIGPSIPNWQTKSN